MKASTFASYHIPPPWFMPGRGLEQLLSDHLGIPKMPTAKENADAAFDEWYTQRGYRTFPDRERAYILWKRGDSALLDDYIARNYKRCPTCAPGHNVYISQLSDCCGLCESKKRESDEMQAFTSIIPDPDAFMKAPSVKRPKVRK